MSILSVNDVTHLYFSKNSKTTALMDISLSIEEGEFVSLIGPSGCGKSTLLSIIAGLISPTVGKVVIEGETVQENKKQIGYMLQQDYLFPWKTIKENILLGLKINGKLTAEKTTQSLQLLAEIGLSGVEEQFPTQLSGGMRQRVALVRTLATNPKLLLLDEPFSALDYQTKLKLEDLVFEILKQYKKTALLVTHDIGEAIAMSDRIILMSKGPGTIFKVFTIPDELKQLTPFEARNHPNYNEYFQQIWKELESFETEN
ncbi:ABC transporter ATP-binding protein [Bacillus kwashiorkori]|uniref:ABC transporter ATP-binding protein n=1 Tax=Bacillus kwashiorkori TaxID=1522318 RepID=UPI000785456E|nr:ABC transporter ATP-binding protein [Bacillus kwashiorkori]